LLLLAVYYWTTLRDCCARTRTRTPGPHRSTHFTLPSVLPCFGFSLARLSRCVLACPAATMPFYCYPSSCATLLYLPAIPLPAPPCRLFFCVTWACWLDGMGCGDYRRAVAVRIRPYLLGLCDAHWFGRLDLWLCWWRAADCWWRRTCSLSAWDGADDVTLNLPPRRCSPVASRVYLQLSVAVSG